MKLPPKERLSSAAIVIALAAVLLVLAVLQYRWSAQVSEAASMRVQANLQASIMGFRQDLYRELSGVCLVFQLNPGSASDNPWTQYAQHYRQWSRTAVRPALVSNVYVWREAGSGRAHFERFDDQSGEFEPAQWPSGFDGLHDKLESFSSDLVAAAQRHPITSSSSPRNPLLMPGGRPGLIPWAVEQTIPALIYPVFEPTASTRSNGEQHPVVLSWLFIEINKNVLHDDIFPELAERYFGGPDRYRVAIVAGEGGQTIYSSDEGSNSKQVAKPDATINLFGPPVGAPTPGPDIFFAPGPPARGGSRNREFHDRAGTVRFEALRLGGDGNDWTLVVQHRNGSLESSAAAIRRRNLAMSFGVLLVLAATMAIMVITSQRARRLAKLQMDFVAAVSHELRTPLTVISSAAENIEDGVVNSQQQMMRYGSVIKSQARQLICLVEQILLFAATRRHVHQYHMQRLEVVELVDGALDATADLIQAAGFTLDKQIQANLPAIEGDPVALSQCLQNLITNALKYGAQAHWLGVRAFLIPVDGIAELQISVEDKGVGIATAEIEHIFEPFYRSASVAAAQIHGTGLGLPLAKSIAEGMNGRLTVSSHPGKGSTFVLHLPIPAPSKRRRAEENAAVAVRKV